MFLQKVTFSFDMMVLVNSDSQEEAARVAKQYVQKQASDCDSGFRVTGCVIAKEYDEVPQEWRDQQPWSDENIDFITCEEIIVGKNPMGEPELDIEDEILACDHCSSHSGLYRCKNCSSKFCYDCICRHKEACLSTQKKGK